MSGHSKWSTIKHKKTTTDQARGKLFSKLSKTISVAVKTGGGTNPDLNSKLKFAIEQARAANMPKENVERAISRAAKEGENLVEIVYEGFGPEGVGIIIEVATDNRNRTAQEIKSLFDRAGGSLAGPGAVAFNFVPKGFIYLTKTKDSENQMLKLIDLGVEDVEEDSQGIEVYVEPNKLSATANKIREAGFEVKAQELVKKPKSLQPIKDPNKAKQALTLLEKLEDHEDVQKVYSNFDIPEELVK